MRFLPAITLLGIVVLDCSGGQPSVAPEKTVPRKREFLFTYEVTVNELLPGQAARVWLPVPPNDDDQEVTIVKRDLPAESRLGAEPRYGNQMLHVQRRASDTGQVPLSVVYRVKRREVIATGQARGREGEDLSRFLQPDDRVPVGGKCLSLLQSRHLPDNELAAARVLYDVVNGHLRYSKEGTGWGRGDAEWACASGHGNCTDFHSLFIALARAQKIPAQFEIGFALPERRGAGEVTGYHCWARFRPQGRGWVPVDISEANRNPTKRDYCFGNLTEDRVAFSVGRDLTLVPKQAGPPLNFFVYPHVEVDSRPYPEEKVRCRFRYEDVDATPGAGDRRDKRSGPGEER